MNRARNRNVFNKDEIIASVLQDTRTQEEVLSSIKNRIRQRSLETMTENEAHEAALRLIRYFEVLVDKPRANLPEK